MAMKNRITVCFLALAVLGAASAAEKKIITASWITGNKTPAELLKEADRLDKTEVDGYTIRFAPVRHSATGAVCRADRLRFNPPWRYEDFEPQLPVVRELLKHKAFKESLIRGWSILDRRVDWRDDKAWANFAHNFGVFARLVKATGAKGIVIDHEDYHKIKQFFRAEGDPDYDELAKIARRRGAEVFSQAFREYPAMVVLSYWMLSLPLDERYCTAQPDLPGLVRHKGDLWPAFFNGILDVLPPEATLVDGCEHGYSFEFFRNDFFRSASLQRTALLELVAPENRRKYRSQLRAGFGLYTTVWFSERKKGYRWWQGPRNGSRLNHFEANLNQAFEAADEYVWIFSEIGTWADWSQEQLLRAMPRQKPERFKSLEERLPGFNSVIAAVKDPIGWGERRIAQMRAKGKLVNLLETGEAVRNDAGSYATLRVGKVNPGERYAYEVVVRPELVRPVFTTRFMKPEADKEQVLWMASRDSLYKPVTNGLVRAFDVVRVPDTGAAFLDAVLLFVKDKDKYNAADAVVEAGVYRIPYVD
jgi:hypothetical protein